jgi:heme exporter protein C
MALAGKILLFVVTAAGTLMAFLYLKPAQGFPREDLARMIAFHLPNAFAAMIAACMAGVFGWRYLTRRNPLDDAKSSVAAALATLFCLLTTVTGMVFAQYQWGAFWNWDPKQTCIFILLLILAAYFLLRSSVDDPEKRGTVAGVYILFAAVMTPLLGYVIPKYMPSLHPTNTTFDRAYWTVIGLMTLCTVGIMAWLQNIGVRYHRARLALEATES